jgi:hypothetical protein
MRPYTIVSSPPVLELVPRVVERDEHLLVEALLTQPTVK